MARTPAITLDSPFHGSYFAEGGILQYRAVKPGTDDWQVKPLVIGDVATSGTIIEGVAQEDALDGESVKVVLFGPTWAYNSGGVARNQRVEAIYVGATTPGEFAAINPALSWVNKMIAGYAMEAAVTLAKFKLFLTRETVTLE